MLAVTDGGIAPSVSEGQTCSRLYGNRVERVMPSSKAPYDPMHLHSRADEMRMLADKMSNDEARRLFLELADDYDKLGDRAADRQAEAKS